MAIDAIKKPINKNEKEIIPQSTHFSPLNADCTAFIDTINDTIDDITPKTNAKNPIIPKGMVIRPTILNIDKTICESGALIIKIREIIKGC